MGNSKTFRIPGPNNTLYEGECDKEGRPHGKGTMKYSDGSHFTGLFNDGAPSKGKFVYHHGGSYDGEIKNNRPEGNGVWKDSNGTFDGNFMKG